jgi:hypothetical protein
MVDDLVWVLLLSGFPSLSFLFCKRGMRVSLPVHCFPGPSRDVVAFSTVSFHTTSVSSTSVSFHTTDAKFVLQQYL